MGTGKLCRVVPVAIVDYQNSERGTPRMEMNRQATRAREYQASSALVAPVLAPDRRQLGPAARPAVSPGQPSGRRPRSGFTQRGPDRPMTQPSRATDRAEPSRPGQRQYSRAYMEVHGGTAYRNRAVQRRVLATRWYGHGVRVAYL